MSPKTPNTNMNTNPNMKNFCVKNFCIQNFENLENIIKTYDTWM